MDDKIINRAKEEGITPQEVADKYMAFSGRWIGWGSSLQLVTLVWLEFMDDIIRFVTDLIERPCLRDTKGCLFPCGKSHNYAKLANKTLEDLEPGASGRTDEETAQGKSCRLCSWKAAKPGEVS